ncbi:MAG TPA: hypothetical protein VML75_12995 [Kofleriaceae bacterium]|nr:hypothetical protein [Kofleriaceae bacterium]
MGRGAIAGIALLVTSTAACGPREQVPRASPIADSPEVAAALPIDGGAPDAAPPPPPPRHLRVFEPPAGVGGLAGEHQVAARVFAFADTQLHYLFGKRTFAQSPVADRMSFEVAVRPAALDDGSDLILDAFLADWRNHYPDHQLVFLGDAADVSCTQEIDEFLSVVRKAGATTMLPVTSNHDGFFVGNFTSRSDLDGKLAVTDMPHDWTRACSEPGLMTDHRLTKGRAVQRLLSVLPEAPMWATSSAWRGVEGPNDYARSHLYYVRRLGGGDPGAPPVWGIFLDTVDYSDFHLPTSEGAGRAGAVSRQQLRFLDRAAFEARAAAPAGATRFVLFGHHPWNELERGSRKRLAEYLDQRPEILAYVAAHTHTPIERSITLPSGRTLPELIVGSTTDAPHAGATFEIHTAGNRAAVAWRRLYLDTGALCRDVPPVPHTSLDYTAYRTVRDGIPDLDIDDLDKLLYAVGLSAFEEQRVVQSIGALLVENELVRAWASLYLNGLGEADVRLQAIVDRRYAAGDDLASLRPWLEGRGTDRVNLSAYDAWADPVGARIVRVAQLGLHRFGPHAEVMRALRDRRHERDPRYFLCHAVHAAAAESRRPRRGQILYIR